GCGRPEGIVQPDHAFPNTRAGGADYVSDLTGSVHVGLTWADCKRPLGGHSRNYAVCVHACRCAAQWRATHEQCRRRALVVSIGHGTRGADLAAAEARIDEGTQSLRAHASRWTLLGGGPQLDA